MSGYMSGTNEETTKIEFIKKVISKTNLLKYVIGRLKSKMEQAKTKKIYTGTIYKVVDGDVVVYVGFTTGDIKKLSIKLQTTTNANIHEYIIQHPTTDLEMVVLDMIEDITITELNLIKKRLKYEYGVIDVVRNKGDDVVDGLVDIDVNNPENNLVMDGYFVEKLEPIHKYDKLPMKCDCGSIFNRATKYRHYKTKKHLVWCIKNRYCPFCGVLGCQADLDRVKNKQQPPMILYDYKTGKKLIV